MEQEQRPPPKSKFVKKEKQDAPQTDDVSSQGDTNKQKPPKRRKSKRNLSADEQAVASIGSEKPETARSKSKVETSTGLNGPSKSRQLELGFKKLDPSILNAVCKNVAEDFWGTAWELCSTRRAYVEGPTIVASELRDTWLSIVEAEWMDTEPTMGEPFSLPHYPDDSPLPPKVDSWAHGALELLPGKCRESIMDPFIREPLPWFLEEVHELILPQRVFPKGFRFEVNDAETSSYDTSQSEVRSEMAGEEFLSAQMESVRHLVRPTSPVPSHFSEGTWSNASTAGGSALNAIIAGNQSNTLSQISLPNSAATTPKSVFESHSYKHKSLEVLFPAMLPDIKASSELEYKLTSGGMDLWKEGGRLQRGSPFVAFKLPGETSSEAVKHIQKWKCSQKKKETTEPPKNHADDGYVNALDKEIGGNFNEGSSLDRCLNVSAELKPKDADR